MKEIKNEFKINRIRSPMVITCPICGFTYRIINPKSGKKKIKCPMCGYITLIFGYRKKIVV
jgi:ribosomal protein S27E